MPRGLLLGILCFLCFSLSAQCISDRYLDSIFHSVTTTSGIYYGTADNYLGISTDLYLDFYEPTGDTLTKRPLIVYAFGGAFLIGTRNQPPIPAYCSYLAQCGYAVASIDYRIGFNVLSTESAERAVYRAAQDLRGAVRFLCQRYSQYKIDTTAIFLTGSSAGCFSGIHSCFMEPSDVPVAIHTGILTEPTDLGCFDCADNADNNRVMPRIRGIINHWGAILDTVFIRPNAKDNVPVISLAGDQDVLVPYTVGYPFSYPVFPIVYGSLPIHYRLDHLGVKNELHPFVGYSHEPWLLAPQLVDSSLRHEVPFLYSILKPLPISISGDTTVCLNYTGSYSVPQRNGSHYCWDAQGGTIVSNAGSSITVQWTNIGTHLLTAREMTMNDVNGDLDSFYVQVVSHPVAAFGDSVLHTSVVFSDSSIGAISWLYEFGDSTHSTQRNPSHVYHKQDQYTVGLIVSNGYCADTTYRTLLTDTCPVVHFIYTVIGDTVFFTADSSNAVNFSWTFGDGNSATGNSVFHIYSHSQSYLIGLTLTSAKACTVSGSEIISYQAPVTGIPGMNEGVGALIHPNPAHDQLTIDCEDCSLKLYDCLGRLVLTKYGLNKSIIDISALDAGIYSFCISFAGHSSYGRVVIK